MYEAKVVADSVANGVRLTTISVTFPRIILAEQNTHRVLSRNTASSRAIPVKTRCDSIEANPFVPTAFGKNKKGMQSDEFLDEEANARAGAIWREALADALKHARKLAEIGVHKEYANRLTEPFAWVTQLVTATDWDNYFNLRCHKDAQREIQYAARAMKDALHNSVPSVKTKGQWHLPFVDPQEGLSDDLALKVSSARCAAVSYEKHNNVKSVHEEVQRHDALLASGHMSPFEHQAKVGSGEELRRHGRFEWADEGNHFSLTSIGNFEAPWLQYRKTLPNERVFRQHV